MPSQPRPAIKPPQPIAMVTPIQALRRKSLEAEAAILGAVLLEATALSKLTGIGLTPDKLQNPAHQIIMTTMLEQQAKLGGVALATMIDALNNKGLLETVGGKTYLYNLATKTPIASFDTHIAAVLDTYARTESAKAAKQTARSIECGDVNPFYAAKDLLDQCSKLYSKSVEDANTDSYYGNAEELWRRHIEPQQHPQEQIRTGYTDIDAQLDGFGPGDYMVLGARPECGKSTLSLNMAVNMAQTTDGVAFFGLEMSRGQNLIRIISGLSGVPSSLIREYRQKNQFTHDNMLKTWQAMHDLNNMRLIIQDSLFDLDAIISTCYKIKASKGLSVVFIDTINLVTWVSSRQSGYYHDQAISRRMKTMASELGVIVIVCAQFSRGAYRGKDDIRPDPSWLQGGAFMHQDPSHILLLHSPDRAFPKVEAIFAKNRHTGKRSIISLFIRPEVDKFESWSELKP